MFPSPIALVSFSKVPLYTSGLATLFLEVDLFLKLHPRESSSRLLTYPNSFSAVSCMFTDIFYSSFSVTLQALFACPLHSYEFQFKHHRRFPFNFTDVLHSICNTKMCILPIYWYLLWVSMCMNSRVFKVIYKVVLHMLYH